MHNDFTTPYAASVPSPLGDAAEYSPCLQLSAVLQRAAAMLMVATMITVALSSVPYPQPPPLPPNAVDAVWPTPNATCSAFCHSSYEPMCTVQNYTEFPPNGRTCVPPPSPPRVLTVYRITPRAYWAWLNNTNLGDAPGDLSYVISTRFSNRDGIDSVITRSVLSVNGGELGPYLMCNPAAGNNWSGAVCKETFQKDNVTYSYYAPGCRCPRANRTFGIISQAFINAAYPEFGNYATRLGGYWYSAPKAARCREDDGEMETDGEDSKDKTAACGWRRQPKSEQLAINASCLYELLDNATRANNRACFERCADPPHPFGPNASACYRHCWATGIDGDSKDSGITPLSRTALLQLWEDAFDGKCQHAFRSL